MEEILIDLYTHEILCRAGDDNHDLYLVKEGKLLVCVNKGTEIIPLGHLGPGEYLGELSFIDHAKRSAHVLAMEPTKLIRIPSSSLKKQLPDWLLTLAQSMTMRIRKTDEIIRHKGLKKKNVSSIDPLDLTQQKFYYDLLFSPV